MMTFYKLLLIGSLGLYGAVGFLGLEFGGGKREPIPASVRQSPGGVRSSHFWHTGFRGGK